MTKTQIFFQIFHRYSNLSTELLVLVTLINKACMKLKPTKFTEDKFSEDFTR